MFASSNIMFLSFIRRLTHSIFQFGLAFFFCGTLAQTTQHTRHPPRLDTQRGIRPAWGWNGTHIFTNFFAPGNFTILRLLYPRLGGVAWHFPSLHGWPLLSTLQASGHGAFSSFSRAWSIPDAPVLLPAPALVCKAASHSYCCSTPLFNPMLSNSRLCKERHEAGCAECLEEWVNGFWTHTQSSFSICTTSWEYKMAPSRTFPH